jgi:O-antigen/teichoic acid export membrane protein
MIGRRTLVLMLAGRTASRLQLWLTGPVLAAAWGRAQFAPYAAAMGVTSALIIFVSAGPEKAALKLLPRARLTRDDLVASLRTLAAVAPVPFIVGAAVASAVAPRSHGTLYLLAAAVWTALGGLTVLTAVYRGTGRPRRDPLTFACLAAASAALLVVTVTLGLSPPRYLWGQLLLTLIAAVPLWLGLRSNRLPVRDGRARSVRRVLCGSIVLMGMPEVLTALCTSTVYFELTLTSHADQASELYLALQGWSLLISVIYVLQRFLQPQLSARLASGADGGGSRRQALRRARALTAFSGAWLAAVGGLLAFGVIGSGLSPAALLVTLVLLCLSRAPLQVLMSRSVFVLENADAAGMRASTYGNALGVLCAVAAGAAVTPVVGAVGAVYALGTKELITGWVITRVASTGDGEEDH